MSLAGSRRRTRDLDDHWPGFVGLLAALLLAVAFLLTVLILVQNVLARDAGARDHAMRRLQDEKTALLARVAAAEKASTETTERAAATFLAMKQDLEGKARAAADAVEKVAPLNERIAALEAELSASEQREREARARIADLDPGLDGYRSDFFASLQQVLGDRPGIRVAGDRFIVQAEVLFGSGRATLDPAGRSELDKIAAALLELDAAIPKEIAWVLRVDGHTDRKPVVSGNFPSNWALSSARATAVVQHLISRRVPPQRLAAAGFGEFHPIDTGDGEEANRRNRRIELKITEK